MDTAILSQANRIANENPDTLQNILAWNYQNYNNAFVKGKQLSIGEQVNFMKHRAGEFRSGKRRDFGHGRYHANEDVHCKKLYYDGEVKIHHFQYEDDADHEECPNDGKGDITAFTSIKDVEAAVIFQIDFEKFLSLLSNEERNIFLKRLEGFTLKEIANDIKLDITTVQRWLRTLCEKYIDWFGLN